MSSGFYKEFGIKTPQVPRWGAGRPDAQPVETWLQVGAEHQEDCFLPPSGYGDFLTLGSDRAVFKPNGRNTGRIGEDTGAGGGAVLDADLGASGLGDLQPGLQLDGGEAGIANTISRQFVKRDGAAGVDETADAVGRDFVKRACFSGARRAMAMAPAL